MCRLQVEILSEPLKNLKIMIAILTFLFVIYLSGVLIGYVFIDYWNISDPFKEKYTFNNALKSWWVVYYLLKQSIK